MPFLFFYDSEMTQTNDSQPVSIEVEDENEESVDVPAQPEPKSKLTIQRKKVSELNDAERLQLINDAKQGIENEIFGVKLFKNGNSRITLKKQTKAQELIKSNSSNQTKLSAPSSKFLTDNQLLYEHIINLETQFNKLHSKHKKLKHRYNELESYLYADDEDEPEAEKPKLKRTETPQGALAPGFREAPPLPLPQVPPEQQAQQSQQEQQQPVLQSNPFIQRRYVKSWRDLRPQ